MRKANLKAIFLGLLARRLRRADDAPEDSPSDFPGGVAMPQEKGAPQSRIAGEARVETTESGQKTASARAETTSEAEVRLQEEPAGPPEDWLAKRSDGPPAHWAERVRQSAPELLQDQERDKASVMVRLQPQRQPQRKQAIPAPLRLERPAHARSPQQNQSGRQEQSGRGAGYPASSDRSVAEAQSERIAHSVSSEALQEPIVEVEPQPVDHSRPSYKKQQPAPPPFSVNSQKRDADAGGGGANEMGDMSSTVQSVRFAALHSRMTREDSRCLTDGNEIGLRETGKAPQLQIGELDEHRDRRQVREEPGIQRLEPAKTTSVKPVKVTEWKESSRIGAQAEVTSRRGANVTSPSPIQAAEHVTRYPDVIHREARRVPARRERFAFDSGYRQVRERQEEVMKPIEPPAAPDRHVISYNASLDRWPALPDAFSADYFDDVMAAWHELSHRRRLTREQTGGLWRE